MSPALKDFVKNGTKILAVMANYKSMPKVKDKPKSVKPGIFMKPTSSYITEGQCIKLPSDFKVNQEIELGVVIGRTCRNVAEKNAMNYVGGYCVALDMTATCQMAEARRLGLPWTIGKGFDSACPVSRFLTLDEIPDPNCVELWCSVNGEHRQCGNTNDFVFSIPELIVYISKYITLHPSDVILTGSPPGMGPVQPGDIIEGGIENLVQIKFTVLEKAH